MASRSTARFSLICILFLSVCTATLLSIASAVEYIVGGDNGWRTLPLDPYLTPQDEGFYTWWAGIHTFYVGDRLNFNNETDSVQLVNSIQYRDCNTSNPLQVLKGNNTVFELRNLGYQHFISGEADNCLAGQKMRVRVMHDGYVSKRGEQYLQAIRIKHYPFH